MRTRTTAALLIGAAWLALGASPDASPDGIDPATLEPLLSRIEERRGLRFVPRPGVEVVAPDDERLAALRGSSADAAGCLPDPAVASVLCLAPPAEEALALALARLLDAQHYPLLAARAATLPGDPGRAVRALLDASARAAATIGLGPPLVEPPPGFLDQDQLEIARSDEDAEAFLALVATSFLRSQRDREAPFRDPPLSTRQLLSPRDYRAGIRPVQLRGAAPELPDCSPLGDESLGAATLLLSATRTGATVPSAPLAGWRGDRAVQLACPNGTAWLYVADFDDAAAAAAFADHAETFVPAAFARPLELARSDRRVVAWHRVPREKALAWAAELRPKELRSLDPLE